MRVTRERDACCVLREQGRAPSNLITQHASRSTSAFTLLEVMIAVAIFFMCVFSILELVSSNLKNVQRLQKSAVDIGSLASELSLTNKLEEGSDSGNFGSLYPGVSWSRNLTMVGTNGLFQVDFVVQDGSGGGRYPVESRLSIFLYRPESPMGISSGIRR